MAYARHQPYRCRVKAAQSRRFTSLLSVTPSDEARGRTRPTRRACQPLEWASTREKSIRPALDVAPAWKSLKSGDALNNDTAPIRLTARIDVIIVADMSALRSVCTASNSEPVEHRVLTMEHRTTIRWRQHRAHAVRIECRRTVRRRPAREHPRLHLWGLRQS